MSWRDIDLKHVYIFCKTWRSRKEIMDQFSLSNIESYHMCRFLSKLTSDIQITKCNGKTRQSFLYKIKDEVLEEYQI